MNDAHYDCEKWVRSWNHRGNGVEALMAPYQFKILNVSDIPCFVSQAEAQKLPD
jgi:hypothetical protein